MDDYPIYKLEQNIIMDYFQGIPRPPKQLYIRGIFPSDPHFVFLTIVGSRNYTLYGKEACEKLIKGLRGYPIVIVSGLALGIDTIVHEAAIATGLVTIAFPGSGLNDKVIYPRSNRALAERILNAGGCLLSEFDHDQQTNDWLFPARNRLLAGISKATLIIEADHKSGSRITTKFATEYNRDVLAVPGSIFSENSEAPNELIRMGATPITSSENLLEALGFQITKQPPLDLFSQCTPDEEKVLKMLSFPLSRGDVIRGLGIPTHQANILISQMELRGLIKDANGEIRRT